MNQVDPRLVLLAGLDQAPEAEALSAEFVASTGATLLLLATGALRSRDAIDRLQAIRARVSESVPILSVGRLDHALAARLQGVLLGRGDMAPNDARRLLGPQALLALEVNDPSDADELYRWRVDLAVCRPASPTTSPPPDIARLAFRVRLAAPGTPFVAACPVDKDTVASVIAAGADGVVCGPPSWPGRIGSAILSAVEEALFARAQLRGHRG